MAPALSAGPTSWDHQSSGRLCFVLTTLIRSLHEASNRERESLVPSTPDEPPFFELVLPPRAAKAAFPVLLAVTLGGIVALPVLGSRRKV
jgi:hypothetical protein